MAGRIAKQDANSNIEPTVIDYEQKSNQLELELAELKELVAQLSSNKTIVSDEDDYEIIPPNKQINVTSLFYGGMTLRGNNEKPIRFENFGITRPISFDDLTHICSNHRRLAEEGAFFIHNKDAIKSLYLEENYKNFIKKEQIENVIDLPEEDIRRITKSLSSELKETVSEVVLAGVKRHIKEGDYKYSNRNKVALIGELCGRDIYKIANDQIEFEK
jgi:hypothetical protein